MDTQITTKDTSSDAFKAVGLKRMGGQQRAIWDVVVGACRNGVRDLSLNEIRDLYERAHGKRIDVSRVSARVSELVKFGRLQRAEKHRVCNVTGYKCLPVYVLPSQDTFFSQGQLWCRGVGGR